MDILIFVLIGLFAGWIGSLIVQNKGFSFIGDLFIGLIGAVAGGLLFEITSISFSNLWGAITMSILGAIVFIFIVRLFSAKGPVHRF